MDEFTHPKTGPKVAMLPDQLQIARRTLKNDEVNSLQQTVKRVLVEEFGAEVRERSGKQVYTFFSFFLLLLLEIDLQHLSLLS